MSEPIIDHGDTRWLNKIDSQGYGLYGCSVPDCPYVAGIHLYAGQPFKIVAGQEVSARHQSSVSLGHIEAAMDLGVWELDENAQRGLKIFGEALAQAIEAAALSGRTPSLQLELPVVEIEYDDEPDVPEAPPTVH